MLNKEITHTFVFDCIIHHGVQLFLARSGSAGRHDLDHVLKNVHAGGDRLLLFRLEAVWKFKVRENGRK